MKTINTNSTVVALKGTIEEQNAFNHKISAELAELFWIDNTKNNINKILYPEVLADDKKEVNFMEEQLAEMFWKKEEVKALNVSNFTLASVMEKQEEYESRVAA